MQNFICPVCCCAKSDTLTFGIITFLGGEILSICMACDRGMIMAFDVKILKVFTKRQIKKIVMKIERR
jgi:hypothetical protein